MADHFPQEILVEILHRLPSKAIVRCISVCKSWRNLITDPSFISRHLHRSPSPHFFLLRLCDDDTYPTVRHSLRHDDHLLSDTFSTLQLPPSFTSQFAVVSITHGLLLCLNNTSYHRYDSFFICNPFLRRFLTLPEPHVPPYVYNASFGFGFDSRNQDYKIVSIVCLEDDKSFGLCAPHVEVYSLASGVWKDHVSASAPVCTLCLASRPAPHGYVNGVVHWGVKRKVDEGWYYFVLSFCFEDEVFGEVLLPQGLVCESLYDDVYVVGGGKDLTVYHVTGTWPCCGDIWVMKEYGVVESWNKVFSFNWIGTENSFEMPLLVKRMINRQICPPVALYVRSSGDMLFVLEDEGYECLYLLDTERKTFVDLQIETEEKGYTWYMYSGYYKESLVLLNRTNGLLSY